MSKQHTLIPNATIQRNEKSRHNSPGRADAASSHHRWPGRGTLPCSLNYQPPVELRAIIILTATTASAVATTSASVVATTSASVVATTSASVVATASAATTTASKPPLPRCFHDDVSRVSELFRVKPSAFIVSLLEMTS